MYLLHAKRTAGQDFSFCLETAQVDILSYPKALTILHLKYKKNIVRHTPISNLAENFFRDMHKLTHLSTSDPSVLIKQYAASGNS